MADAFVIMQIGNAEMDAIHDSVIVPAIRDSGLLPKRVDKHNQGGLLKSEIIDFIKGAEVVVADITNERPNCYLEIGYAMGHADGANLPTKLILTCREDHRPDSPSHSPGGPKVHFDLAGYDICYWHPEALADFRESLTARIRKRRQHLRAANVRHENPFDRTWFYSQRDGAIKAKSAERTGFMEFRGDLIPSIAAWKLADLERAAHPFSLPQIGDQDETGKIDVQRLQSGIVIRNIGEDDAWYLYWTCQKDGSFYGLSTYPENLRSNSGAISAEKRVLQIANLLACTWSFYSTLGVPKDTLVRIAVQHVGIMERTLKATRYGSGPRLGPPAQHYALSDPRERSLADLRENMADCVEDTAESLFELFRFEMPSAEYRFLIDSFVSGKKALWSLG